MDFLKRPTKAQEADEVKRWEIALARFKDMGYSPHASEAEVRAWADEYAELTIEMSRLMAQRGIKGSLEEQFNEVLRLLDTHVVAA